MTSIDLYAHKKHISRHFDDCMLWLASATCHRTLPALKHSKQHYYFCTSASKATCYTSPPESRWLQFLRGWETSLLINLCTRKYDYYNHISPICCLWHNNNNNNTDTNIAITCKSVYWIIIKEKESYFDWAREDAGDMTIWSLQNKLKPHLILI
jgi:hypothetical protein